MTLTEQLERNANTHPDKAAIIFHASVLTYRQLNEVVNRVASGMLRAGLQKGDRVGMMLPRVPELVITFLASAKAGGVAVPINFEQPPDSIRSLLARTGPRILVASETFSSLVRESLPLINETTVIVVGEADSGWLSWSTLLGSGDPANPVMPVHPDDVVYLNYTSGSTGDSKGAVTTHNHIHWNTIASTKALGLTHDDIHLCMFAPFAHPHELFARPLYLGGTMVMLENVYPKSLAQAIADNRVTCMMGLAPMYENLLELLQHKVYNLSSLRIPESGGMFTRLDLIERFEKKVGVPVLPVWGSTETTGIALANRPGKSVIPLSAGQPCPSYEVKIVDEEGAELPCGEIGEMIFKGPGVIQSYYKNTDTACFKDGWYYSGDLARRDEQGNFFFIERKKGMMKVAGLKVFPLEIEQVLMDHPDVKEAAVIAVKDRLRGEVPKAVIVPQNDSLTEKEVLVFCRDRLAHYKVPRIIEMRKSLPKIGSGKINKKALQLEHA